VAEAEIHDQTASYNSPVLRNNKEARQKLSKLQSSRRGTDSPSGFRYLAS